MSDKGPEPNSMADFDIELLFPSDSVISGNKRIQSLVNFHDIELHTKNTVNI